MGRHGRVLGEKELQTNKSHLKEPVRGEDDERVLGEGSCKILEGAIELRM